MKVPMGPPPPKTPINPSPKDGNPSTEPQTDPQHESQTKQIETHASESDSQNETPSSNTGEPPKVAVPYEIPPWSESPRHQFFLEVLKDGSIIDQFDVSGKGAYMFGRIDLCDFVLEHPTISRFHAVLQFKKDGDAFLYDLGSTHGTFVNKTQVKKKVYSELHVGDVIRFGQSSRLYIFQGPSELMPQESDTKKLRNARLREEMQDREASLLRASVEASLADGISWGLSEDAIEEVTEDDADEVTWQTYKGQLTEKQEKTREKIIKRTEKVANMKKEIDAIRVKDIAQGGLTQGQQTQIARNEQRIAQILEELENLEETLNESIQESIGARAGKVSYSKKKGTTDDGDEATSDEDEFYDRTKKRSAIQKISERSSVETADTLLDKKEIIVKEMEEKTNLLLTEKTKIAPPIESDNESGDALDAYMTGLSSQLVVDTTLRLQKEISSLQTELDRIVYLLKIADPTGEAIQRRDSKAQSQMSNQPETSTSDISKKPKPPVEKKTSPASETVREESLPVVETSKPEEDKNSSEGTESKTRLYPVTKPRWLGATQDMLIKENQQQEAPLNDHESADGFVDYRNRKEALAHVDDATKATKEPMIEDAAHGLIIRKRKHEEKTIETEDIAPNVSTSLSAEAETEALEAVALLLKHKRGYFASDEVERDESLETQGRNQSRKDNSKPNRVLGPERPDFLNGSIDYETWVPPQGQSGDGRTSLNDRYGY